ncbi:MAG: ATP-grasp domain-containing protein [Treponema sp.]|uniref:ATP-grasp domain-containing protein n=1 Tax=Treponema sp. TaxID=166 RepID=UPI0025D09ADE|nr:ATP-grasp domain-containing protein [Treponema sp.]MBQ8679227.1 ATP-grasp domain-containing protein [Treponema sp.]
MRILFFSTSSSLYDGENILTKTLPSWAEQWETLARKLPEHEFVIASQLPGMFMLDLMGNEIAQKSEKIQYHLIQNDSEKKIAEEIADLKPDLAIALSFYATPYDWLTVKDAMVADFLRKTGIRTICHPVESALICFDKWRTHDFLEKIGVNCAKAVYMHHELYINGGNRRELKSNVYRDAIFHEIKKLKFPVIIKDTTGLSSFGADVVNNFEEALGILRSKKTTSDRIIEEMISGDQFGCEIYGKFDEKKGRGDYTILPPFLFSVNQYGITSPKQSVKIGPFLEENEALNEKYKLSELRKMLLKMAKALKLNGIAQVDLVFNGKKWFVIEVNPRLSGMSTTYAASSGLPLSEVIFEYLMTSSQNAQSSQRFGFQFKPTVNIKFPIMPEERLLELKALPYTVFVNQIENRAARQIREQGYCEVIVTGETRDELLENLCDLRERFADIAEEHFFETAIFLGEKQRLCEG